MENTVIPKETSKIIKNCCREIEKSQILIDKLQKEIENKDSTFDTMTENHSKIMDLNEIIKKNKEIIYNIAKKL